MTKVQMDGRTFDFAIDTSLLEVDSTNPGSTAERDTLVRRQLAKWNPATADAQLEWGTSPSGEVLITVSRQAKTKGQDFRAHARPQPGAGSPAECSPGGS